MKRYFLKTVVISLVATTVFYLSCDKKKLDLLPHGPTELNYFTQESDFAKAVFGVYAKMSDIYWYNAGSPLSPMIYLEGDDITTNSSDQPFEVFGPLQPSNGSVSYFMLIYIR